MTNHFLIRFCLVIPLLWSAVSAQESTKPSKEILRGTWIASAGEARYFRGIWSGELLPGNHNSGQGSWVLLNDRSETVTEGTWAARKSARAWEGTWTARPSGGGSFSGTWTADITDLEKGTFEDMLNRTFEKQVSGSWRHGRTEGNWSLQGSH